ncbi:O-antigen ligase family protein [Prosthecobacter sp.]|uniref:O-antigen ligase family protein n=1 Tax=Prosthecobacter sp. TaxID=1965333 RepID=UPI002ABBF1B0|nr:O-antigen ligase family protein [Prosthecobacter sp.]MDZ4402117.1 O-antigen ligase family protein [Prosthecobacter sp.]
MRTLAPAVTNEFATQALRQHVTGPVALQTAVTGFIAGHACLPNEWLHLGWLLVAGFFAIAWSDWRPNLTRWSVDPGGVLTTAFLLWMTARSCFSEAFMHGDASAEITRGLLGTMLLVLFCTLAWQQAQKTEALHAVGWVAGMIAAFSALISIVLSYFVLPDHHAGERLTNLLVHGGLNPVCTGLTFGFAAVWLAALMENETTPLPRRFMWAAIAFLHLAAFLSASRGAMLALLCGHAALLIARGWRRGAAAACVFIVTGAIYFTSAPLLAKLDRWRVESAELAAHQPGITHHLQQAVERGDNGRLDIYRAGWNAIDNPWLGTGQWGVREVWQCELQASDDTLMSHLHSAFFATFVHGGVIGAVLLLGLLMCAVRRAWRISVHGDATWIALLAFGCGGLLFDGESLTSLATAPRFEGLLFWLPLMVALVRGGKSHASTLAESA